MMKPASILLIVLVCLFMFSSIMPAAVIQAAPTTNAQAAALIDVSSGRLLYSYQGDKVMRIASLTKVMTAIVAIENGNLEDKVKVSSKAFGVEGSSIYLKLGEEMSLHHMLYGLLLRSGNDAATAIAEHVGGSVEGFAYLMNKKAEELGMSNSSFKNPHGLDEEDHYSSANDMAKLAAYALKNDAFKEIVKTKKIKVPNSHEKWDHVWHNKNRMLSMYEGADGVKTGYTKLAKRTLITSATRNGQQLAAVTLNDGSDWVDHSKLFDYGFKYFPHKNLLEKGKALKGTPFVPVESFTYPLNQDEISQIKVSITEIKADTINYSLGERAKLELLLKGKLIGSVLLVEPDSPRLDLNHNQSAFSFTKSDTTSNSYWASFNRMLKAIFSF
jgi:D-alanyl-D-alanine carboxypeptidase (penicillin-binding protein 5/6)